MVVRFITVDVVPGRDGEFERATIENREGSLREPGVLRFDLLKSSDTAHRYHLIEAYRDQAATEAHKQTPHYSTWRERVAPMMAAGRTSVSGVPVAPAAPEAWRP